MEQSQRIEKFIVSVLLVLALLTFFFPLITFQIPVLGAQNVSGYDIFSKMRELQEKMPSMPRQSGEPSSEASRSLGNEPSMPISLQSIDLVPLEVILAFICTVIALAGGCVGTVRHSHLKVTAAIGSLAAVTAILHLTVLNSDLHVWFQESMRANADELRDNPYAGFTQQLGSLIANAFQIAPGTGLYILAGTLALVFFLVYSRLLAGTQEAGPAEAESAGVRPAALPENIGTSNIASAKPSTQKIPEPEPQREPQYNIVGDPINPTQDE